NGGTMRKMFPHRYIPCSYWLREGIIKAITKAEYLKMENIRKVYSKEKINWPIGDLNHLFDESRPIFSYNAGTQLLYGEPMYMSGLTRAMEGIARAQIIKRDSSKRTQRYTLINCTILEL